MSDNKWYFAPISPKPRIYFIEQDFEQAEFLDTGKDWEDFPAIGFTFIFLDEIKGRDYPFSPGE